MPHEDMFVHFQRIDSLAKEIEKHVPLSKIGTAEIRADMAGLLVVAIVAMYETCVKETMIAYAGQKSLHLQGFVERTYDKLSSKIETGDLRKYAKTFEPELNEHFGEILRRRKQMADKLTGKNVETQLTTILKWRHQYAHAGIRLTTIEDPIKTHRLAKVVILSFHDAFFPTAN